MNLPLEYIPRRCIDGKTRNVLLTGIYCKNYYFSRDLCESGCSLTRQECSYRRSWPRRCKDFEVEEV